MKSSQLAVVKYIYFRLKDRTEQLQLHIFLAQESVKIKFGTNYFNDPPLHHIPTHHTITKERYVNWFTCQLVRNVYCRGLNYKLSQQFQTLLTLNNHIMVVGSSYRDRISAKF
jgi:hypothetical protein